MCERDKNKELPDISINSREERKKIMKDFEALHTEVMDFLDNFKKEKE